MYVTQMYPNLPGFIILLIGCAVFGVFAIFGKQFFSFLTSTKTYKYPERQPFSPDFLTSFFRFFFVCGVIGAGAYAFWLFGGH